MNIWKWLVFIVLAATLSIATATNAQEATPEPTAEVDIYTEMAKYAYTPIEIQAVDEGFAVRAEKFLYENEEGISLFEHAIFAEGAKLFSVEYYQMIVGWDAEAGVALVADFKVNSLNIYHYLSGDIYTVVAGSAGERLIVDALTDKLSDHFLITTGIIVDKEWQSEMFIVDYHASRVHEFTPEQQSRYYPSQMTFIDGIVDARGYTDTRTYRMVLNIFDAEMFFEGFWRDTDLNFGFTHESALTIEGAETTISGCQIEPSTKECIAGTEYERTTPTVFNRSVYLRAGYMHTEDESILIGAGSSSVYSDARKNVEVFMYSVTQDDHFPVQEPHLMDAFAPVSMGMALTPEGVYALIWYRRIYVVNLPKALEAGQPYTDITETVFGDWTYAEK